MWRTQWIMSVPGLLPLLPSTHYVDNRIYTDPVIFEEEREKILAATWRLVCHESELPEPGDYRAKEIAGVPVVILRSEDRSIMAFFNVCPHRGARLVRDERKCEEGPAVPLSSMDVCARR